MAEWRTASLRLTWPWGSCEALGQLLVSNRGLGGWPHAGSCRSAVARGRCEPERRRMRRLRGRGLLWGRDL